MMHGNNPVRWGDRNYRSYTAGMALAAPFAAATLPYPWLLLALAMGVPFIIQMAKRGLHLPEMKRIPLIIWLISIIFLLHTYGLLVSVTPYWTRVLVDMAIVAASIGVFLLGRGDSDCRGEMINGFFSALIPFAFLAALFGLVKAFLLERGILIGFLVDLYQDLYPSGSSLRGDYNLYGLSMLIAGLGIVFARFQEIHGLRRNAFHIVVLAVLISAGMLTASRRFLVFSMLIPILWVALCVRVVPLRKFAKEVLLPIAGMACVVGLIFLAVRNPVPVKDATVIYVNKPSREIVDFTIRKTDPDTLVRVMGTVQENYVYGFDTRIPKWRLGWDLLSDGNWIKGMGFDYHTAFSCRFVNCQYMDYPHFPIMSEVLIGGFGGGLVSIAVYLMFFLSVWRSGRKGLLNGSSVIALAVFPYSILSGDTLFSVPQFIIICLLVESQLASGNHAAQDDALLQPMRLRPKE